MYCHSKEIINACFIKIFFFACYNFKSSSKWISRLKTDFFDVMNSSTHFRTFISKSHTEGTSALTKIDKNRKKQDTNNM